MLKCGIVAFVARAGPMVVDVKVVVLMVHFLKARCSSPSDAEV